MKRWLSWGFWIGLLYLIAFANLPVLKTFVNTSMIGVYIHVLMVCLLVVGFFTYVLRVVHYLFVK